MDKTHSWGEFYETAKACDNYEEIKGKFAIFEALDKAKIWREIQEIIRPLTTDQVNWLNSPCLDGLRYLNLRATSDFVFDLCYALSDYVETLKFLTEKNLIPLEQINLFNFTVACDRGSIETVKWMLSLKRIDINGRNYNVRTPLTSTCGSGQLEIVKILIENGADIHIDQDRPLLASCEYGHIEIVKFLLEKGARIYADSPLYEAASLGNTKVVELLLDHGAIITDRVLTAAFYENRADTVKLLLSCGANVRCIVKNYKEKLDTCRAVLNKMEEN